MAGLTMAFAIASAVSALVKGAIKLYGAYNKLYIKAYENFQKTFKKQEEGILKVLGPWEKINKVSSAVAKNIGLSGEAMNKFGKQFTKLAADRELGHKYGISTEQLMSQISGIYNATGRKVGISNENGENIAAMSSVMGEGMTTEFISKMDNFGMSIQDAAKMSGKMFSKAAKSGIDFQKYSKNFLNNIQKAQTYNFKNGVKGVEEMAKKATEMKFSIEEAAKFSSKVNNLEGALNVGAQLQALGGSFAQFANPLEMLNESYTSMEDMYDRMVNMMGTHGKFNSETGQVEVNGMDKKRIQVAAEAMGVSYDSMMEGIHTKGRRDEIKRQLGNRKDLSEDMIDMIVNTGTFENGRAGIVDEFGNFKDISKITMADEKRLLEMNQTEGEDIKDIARDVQAISDMMKGQEHDRDATYASRSDVQNYGKSVTEAYKNADLRGRNAQNASMQWAAGKAEQRNLDFEGNIASLSFSNLATGSLGSSGKIDVPKAAEGGTNTAVGFVKGKTHAEGGEQYIDKTTGENRELEDGEYIWPRWITEMFSSIIKGTNETNGNPINFLKNIFKAVSSRISNNNSNNKVKSSYGDKIKKGELKNRVSNLFNNVNNIDNSSASSISPDIKRMSPEPVSPSVSVNKPESSPTNGNRMSFEPLNINLSGSIKLEGKNGSSVEITKDILEDRGFIRQLTALIEREISERTYGKPVNKGNF